MNITGYGKCVHGVAHSREEFLAAAAWAQRVYGDATLEDVGLRCWIEAWRAANPPVTKGGRQ